MTGPINMASVAAEMARDVSTARAAIDDLQAAVLWELPRTHKGFHCTYDHETVVRAFERARKKLAAGEVPKRCRCSYCQARGEAA